MTSKTIEVTGRNGSTYNATHLRDSLYVVGMYVVIIENGRCVHTVGKASEDADAKKIVARRRAAANRKAKDEMMKDMGLTKCKDSAGRTIWE